jgi:hypothetical protein
MQQRARNRNRSFYLFVVYGLSSLKKIILSSRVPRSEGAHLLEKKKRKGKKTNHKKKKPPEEGTRAKKFFY